MKFTIKHEKKGRIRVHLFQKYMNFTQADTLQYYLENLDGVKKAQVFNRTSDALIYYTGERNELLKAIQAFGYSRVSVPAQVLENSGRELNETYKEKLVNKVIFQSVFLFSAAISPQLVLLCSCLESENCLRSGPTRNLWMIWHVPCL